MRISFDLDDTLICYDPAVPCENSRVPWLLRHWFKEPLREGAVALMRDLATRGCRICVFTTSYRSPRQVKWWLRFYGVHVETVINQQAYRKHVSMSHFERRGSVARRNTRQHLKSIYTWMIPRGEDGGGRTRI